MGSVRHDIEGYVIDYWRGNKYIGYIWIGPDAPGWWGFTNDIEKGLMDTKEEAYKTMLLIFESTHEPVMMHLYPVATDFDVALCRDKLNPICELYRKVEIKR